MLWHHCKRPVGHLKVGQKGWGRRRGFMFSVEITESLSGCSQSRLCGSCRNPPDTVYKREAEKRQAAVSVTDNRESLTQGDGPGMCLKKKRARRVRSALIRLCPGMPCVPLPSRVNEGTPPLLQCPFGNNQNPPTPSFFINCFQTLDSSQTRLFPFALILTLS